MPLQRRIGVSTGIVLLFRQLQLRDDVAHLVDEDVRGADHRAGLGVVADVVHEGQRTNPEAPGHHLVALGAEFLRTGKERGDRGSGVPAGDEPDQAHFALA